MPEAIQTETVPLDLIFSELYLSISISRSLNLRRRMVHISELRDVSSSSVHDVLRSLALPFHSIFEFVVV